MLQVMLTKALPNQMDLLNIAYNQYNVIELVKKIALNKIIMRNLCTIFLEAVHFFLHIVYC